MSDGPSSQHHVPSNFFFRIKILASSLQGPALAFFSLSVSSSNTQNYGLNYLPGSSDEHDRAKWDTIVHNRAHSDLNEAVIRSDFHNITKWAHITVLNVISLKVKTHCAFTSRALILGVLELAKDDDVNSESVLHSVE